MNARRGFSSPDFEQGAKSEHDTAPERLVSVGIVRDGVHLGGGTNLLAHWQLRAVLGDHDPHARRADDTEGFWTSEGRFVTRAEAHDIALASGQLRKPLARRELLSSDITWNAI